MIFVINYFVIVYAYQFNWTLFLRELFRDVEPKIYEQLMSANSDNFEILISNKDYLYDMFELFSKTRTVIISKY